MEQVITPDDSTLIVGESFGACLTAFPIAFDGVLGPRREWAALERVEALDRLVSLLRLNREAGDLGRLITDEARSIRRDVHRQLIETIERRSQQVWIPVTVATLVPGVIFLAIPFTEAMRLFTQS